MDFPSDIVESLAYQNLSLIHIADLSEEEAARIPAWWKEVLVLPEHERIARAITEWNRALPSRFRKFVEQLARTGTGIYLARDTNMRLHLLYVARGTDTQGSLRSWAGAMPLGSDNPGVRPDLPVELLEFHSTVHDGFRQITGSYVIWLPMREMFSLSDNFDVNDPDIEFYGTPPDFNPHKVDLKPVIAVFIGSSCGYGVDTANQENPTAGWYWFEGSLEPIADFWDDADELMLATTG